MMRRGLKYWLTLTLVVVSAIVALAVQPPRSAEWTADVMPEVLVTAEAPGRTMDTVVVSAPRGLLESPAPVMFQ